MEVPRALGPARNTGPASGSRAEPSPASLAGAFPPSRCFCVYSICNVHSGELGNRGKPFTVHIPHFINMWFKFYSLTCFSSYLKTCLNKRILFTREGRILKIKNVYGPLYLERPYMATVYLTFRMTPRGTQETGKGVPMRLRSPSNQNMMNLAQAGVCNPH